MDLLEAASIESNQVWKAAGKPRHGPIFDKRQSSCLLYRNKIRVNQSLSKTCYSNDLHDALLETTIKASASGIVGTRRLNRISNAAR